MTAHAHPSSLRSKPIPKRRRRSRPPGSRVTLLAGASGHIGRLLLRELERTGTPLRCLTWRPEVLRERVARHTQLVAADALDAVSLPPAVEGIHTAFYLVPPGARRGHFDALDRRAARNFGTAAAVAGVAQIVCLGDLGDFGDLSTRPARHRGVASSLRLGGVPTLELRAAVAIASAGFSNEMPPASAEPPPLIATPPREAVSSRVATDDVITAMLAAQRLEEPVDATREIAVRIGLPRSHERLRA